LTERSNPTVVHVLWRGELGGIERLVRDLAAEQIRLGVAVAVAFGQAEGLFVDRIAGLGVPVLDLGVRSGYDLRSRRLAAGARSLARFEVIHAHGFNLPLGEIMRRAGRPIVFTEHGQFGLGRRVGLTGAIKRRAQRRFLAERCTVIAANSGWTARRLSDTYGIEPDRVTVVPNGIEPVPAPPRHRHEGNDRPLVVAFVGGLKRFKRVDRIIRALARVRDRESVRVLIAGGGTLEDELRALARELGVESQVSFLGWQPDVVPVLAEADVVVLPSEGEPFGLAMLEGSAQGLLPIAFADGGGALECITPDGRVVQDVDELAAIFSELKRSDALSSAAREARSSWANERFPIAKTALRYLELYRSAITSPPPGQSR
jgi:glycosyltransferase involved in cell wall biosynthesis